MKQLSKLTRAEREVYNTGFRYGFAHGRLDPERKEASRPMTFPCWNCGAADSRDRNHQRGCPKIPPLSKAALLRLAVAVEEGWKRKKK